MNYDIPQSAKYLVTKRRNTGGKEAYTVKLENDAELAEHIAGTFKNTDHEILGVLNLQPLFTP